MRILLPLLLLHCAIANASPPASVEKLKITVLSTMVAEINTIGEWGFSALVEADGHRLLVDTGASPDAVLKNAQVLGIDLSGVEDVVLTHFHPDHTNGLLALRRELSGKNPRALCRAHVASAIFLSRPDKDGETNPMLAHRAEMEKAGIRFVVHDAPAELFPGVWFTGPVPREFPERNFAEGRTLVSAQDEKIDDTVPEDASILFNTSRGIVLLSGCGHAGVVNTMSYAQKLIPSRPVSALVGGFHLFALDDKRLEWTLDQFGKRGVKTILGAHCTGFEAIYRARERLHLPRNAAVVSAVGTTFSSADGIAAGGWGLVR